MAIIMNSASASGSNGYVPVAIKSWTHTSESPSSNSGVFTQNVSVGDLIVVTKKHVIPTIHSDNGSFNDVSSDYGFNGSTDKVYECTSDATSFWFTYGASYSEGAWVLLTKE